MGEWGGTSDRFLLGKGTKMVPRSGESMLCQQQLVPAITRASRLHYSSSSSHRLFLILGAGKTPLPPLSQHSISSQAQHHSTHFPPSPAGTFSRAQTLLVTPLPLISFLWSNFCFILDETKLLQKSQSGGELSSRHWFPRYSALWDINATIARDCAILQV